ncbi:MAG: class I SAM-dependent methyltransferase [Candidatus Cloacimonadota bacterium]|nr:MAG: class I SAM-dependent methyltransferase [Candidatus Cloacimonadota bacterium]
MIQWDDYWKQYKASEAEKWLISERDSIFKRYLDRIDATRKKVLEVGCGFGSNLRLLNTTRDDVESFGLDTSGEAINAIKTVIQNAVVADCRKTGFPDNEFDMVYSAGLMEHFRDEVPFLNEMRRIVKSEGYVITIVPARYSLWKLYQLLHFGLWQHGYEKAYTHDGLKRLFLENNYRVVEITGIDPFSIFGFLMKLLNKSFNPCIKQSPQKSAYTELCIIAKKR